MRFIALVDGRKGAYGVSFPDAHGCTAMGATLEEATGNAATALSEWVNDEIVAGRKRPRPRSADALREDREVASAIRSGALLTLVPLVMETGKATKANLSMDSGLLAAVDEAAARAGVTRSAFFASSAKERIVSGG